MKTSKLSVRVTLLDDILGTSPSNGEVYKEFIGSKAPDASTIEDEVARLGADEVAQKGMTVFPRTAEGKPFIYDYQVRGFFKSACQALSKIAGTKSSKLKAYKKEIDLRIFIKEREIPFIGKNLEDVSISLCQRPLRAMTMQGERVSLACSESVPAGTMFQFTVECLNPDDLDLVREWLDYAQYNGFGQWRNSGKGRAYWEELNENGATIGGNHEEFE